jgi:hypothetical protein
MTEKDDRVMDYQQAKDLLHDYVDRSLPEDKRRELELFLQQSPELRQEFAALRHLLDLAAQMAPEVEPTRDLWPGIAEALPDTSEREHREIQPHGLVTRLRRWHREWPSRPAASWRPLFAAAAVLALVFIVALYQRSGDRRFEIAGNGLDTIQTWQADFAVPVLDALGMECDRVSHPAVTPWGSVDSWESADSQGLIAHNLRIVDLAIAEVYQAWMADPQNRALTRQLKNVYRSKADLQSRAIELATQI